MYAINKIQQHVRGSEDNSELVIDTQVLEDNILRELQTYLAFIRNSIMCTNRSMQRWDARCEA